MKTLFGWVRNQAVIPVIVGEKSRLHALVNSGQNVLIAWLRQLPNVQ